jgi:hypothetical protein
LCSCSGSKWAYLRGGKIAVPDCGDIDSYGQGIAAFFSESGSRYIETQPLDLTSANTISFMIQIGGGGACETADSGEDVVLEYQPLGTSTFTELKRMDYNGRDTPAVISALIFKSTHFITYMQGTRVQRTLLLAFLQRQQPIALSYDGGRYHTVAFPQTSGRWTKFRSQIPSLFQSHIQRAFRQRAACAV